jgi:hypothetical protein
LFLFKANNHSYLEVQEIVECMIHRVRYVTYFELVEHSTSADIISGRLFTILFTIIFPKFSFYFRIFAHICVHLFSIPFVLHCRLAHFYCFNYWVNISYSLYNEEIIMQFLLPPITSHILQSINFPQYIFLNLFHREGTKQCATSIYYLISSSW